MTTETDYLDESGAGGLETAAGGLLDQRGDEGLDRLDQRDGLDHREYDEVEDYAADSVSLFEGDEGGLDYPQRQTLVALLKQRFISARTHPRDWQVLVENERIFRSRLNDVFLDLQIDRDREVAWKRQAQAEGGGRFPTLLHDTAWSREETLVLVHLRDRLRAGLAGGDVRVFIDRDDLLDYVASYRPTHATDEAGDEKRARNAVISIVKAGLLIATATEDRFEISEAVEPLLPLELLLELLDALQKANGTEVVEGGEDADLFDEAAEGLDTPLVPRGYSTNGGGGYSTNGGGGYSTNGGGGYSTNGGGDQ